MLTTSLYYTGKQLESNNDHMQPQISNPTSLNFDPDLFYNEDDNTFVAQGVITEYLEKHFRCTLSKASRTAMHKAHPVPRTFAAKPPVVYKFVKDYLKSRYPKQDGELAKLQSAMLKACGPMTCMWSDLIEQNLLEDPDATISVHDMLEIIQRSLVLLGNTNEMLSQMRRTNLLKLADESLGKYAQDLPSQAGELLFGPEFAKHLQDKVKADVLLAKVVATSQRYHPYNNKSRTTTIGHSKQQFFEGALLEVWGHSRANPTPQHIHKTTSLVPSQNWNPDTHLPGQHALKRTVKATTSGTSFHSHLGVGIAGIRNQCAEISPDSIKNQLGVNNQYQRNDHVNGPTNTTLNRRLLTPEPRPETTSLPAGRELVPDHLAYLRQHFKIQRLSPRAAELLIETWRGNTNDAYNTAWRKWLAGVRNWISIPFRHLW